MSNSCDCHLPVSFVSGILRARILEWVANSFSRGSSRPRNWTQVSCLQADSLPTELQGKPSLLFGTLNSLSFWVSIYSLFGPRFLITCFRLCFPVLYLYAYALDSVYPDQTSFICSCAYWTSTTGNLTSIWNSNVLWNISKFTKMNLLYHF